MPRTGLARPRLLHPLRTGGAAMTSQFRPDASWPTLLDALERLRMWQHAHKMAQAMLGAVLAIAVWSALDTYRYSIAYGTAVAGSVRLMALAVFEHAVALYDPYSPRLAPTGPADAARLTEFRALEELLPVGRAVRVAGGTVTLTDVQNEVIRESPLEFSYQPWDEPRLHELRRRYNLPQVIRGARNDFEELVRLRNWTRSQFRRRTISR